MAPEWPVLSEFQLSPESQSRAPLALHHHQLSSNCIVTWIKNLKVRLVLYILVTVNSLRNRFTYLGDIFSSELLCQMFTRENILIDVCELYVMFNIEIIGTQ